MIFCCVILFYLVDILNGFESSRFYIYNINNQKLNCKYFKNNFLRCSSIVVKSSVSKFSPLYAANTVIRNTLTKPIRVKPFGKAGMGSGINEYIISLFTKTTERGYIGTMNNNNFTELKSYLYEYEHQLTYVHGITLMLQCSKHKISLINVIPLAFLNKILNSSLNKKIRKVYSSDSHVVTKTIANTMEIMNNERDKSEGDVNLNVYEPREIANALYGLKSVCIQHSSPPYVKSGTKTSAVFKEHTELLTTIVKLISLCNESKSFSGQHIANSYYGLQHLKSELSVTRQLLSVLNDKVRRSLSVAPVQLNELEIGLALYGAY